ncbi:MAG: hypothetical protein J6T62_12290, partial [Fibrobacter sp.]|nr:hypothetical protein [Fibrobacter sp.]
TMERPDRSLADTILTDPVIGRNIKGAAFQWAGREALPIIHDSYPDLMEIPAQSDPVVVL